MRAGRALLVIVNAWGMVASCGAGTAGAFDGGLQPVAVGSGVMAVGSPVPYDGAANVDPVGLSLSWPAVADAKSYSVYFGADSAEPPLLQTVTQPRLKLAAPLVPGRCCYWRVDTAAVDGTVIRGPLWRFTLRSPTPTDPDLLAWYAFDEAAGTAACDLAGHGSEARMTGMTRSTTGVPGLDGGSIASDGSGNVQFSIPGAPVPFGGLTLTGWFRIDRQDRSGAFWCLGNGPDSCITLLSNATNGGGLVIDAVEKTRKERVTSPATDPLQTERWTHLAVTMNASARGVVVYQDGAAVLRVKEMTCLADILEQATQVSLGASFAPDLGLAGGLDDIRLYGRVLDPEDLARTMVGHPDSPYGPDPPLWAQRHISAPAVLRWQGPEGAAGYDVYTGSEPGNMRMVRRALDKTEYALKEPPADGQTLYWQVEALGAGGFLRGPLWQFSVTKQSLDDIVVDRRQDWWADYTEYYGRVAPDLSLTDVDGRGHRIRDYRGRHLLVVLWAPWCPACRTEMGHLSGLREIIGADELALLAITDTSNSDTLPGFLADRPEITFPVALRKLSTLPAPFGTITRIPSGFYIAPDGTIKLAIIGAVSPEEIQAILHAAWLYTP